MTISLDELLPQNIPSASRVLFGDGAKRILDITPICPAIQPRQLARLYYHKQEKEGRPIFVSVFVQIISRDDSKTQGTFLTVDLTECGVHAKNDGVSPTYIPECLGFTFHGLCKIIERFSPFTKSDFAKPENLQTGAVA